jgi:hypothetical protein
MNNSNLQTKRAPRFVLFILLLCAVGMTNSFAYDFSAETTDGQTLYYTITNDSTHTVMVTHPFGDTRFPYSGYTKPTGDLIIPYYVEYNGIGYSVTAIDEYAFGTNYSTDGIFDYYSCSGLTSVVIPSSVLTIGQRAFQNCTGITTVNIPTSVTSISNDVFHNCNNLVTVDFNAINCQSVGESTWAECTKFTTLNIGSTVTRIPTNGFQGATKLTTVSLPNSLTTIGNYGFDGCTALTTVIFGDASTLATVGDYSFHSCSNLANIELPNTITTIGNYAFSGCTKLKSTSATQLLPDALTSIGDYAFQNAATLAYIRIPSTLTSLGKYAFQRCTALNTVIYEAAECTYSGTSTEPPFYGCSALATVQMSSNVTQIPAYCFKDCTALTSLMFRDGLTTIGTYAFYGCLNIDPLVIPATVDSIASFAFGNSYDLQLSQVWSLNTTSPVISAEAVFPVGQTIYVPSASVDAYQNDVNWSNYNIVGMDMFGEYEIVATANIEWGGTLTGAGSFESGSICTLTAIADVGFHFLNWTKDGTVVSNSETYSFIVTEDASFMANFEPGVLIGAGSMVANPSLPSDTRFKYSLSQQIYTAEEIGMGGAINSVAFYANRGMTRNYNIYMVSTEKTVFENANDWISVTENDLVFSGEVTINSNNWTVFMFDTPFQYDGESNVVLVVDDNSGNEIDASYFRVFDTQGDQAIYIRGNNTDYNPYNPSGNNGTLKSGKNQVILGFEREIYSVVVSSNSEEYGTVSGGRNYMSGSTATVTAIPNLGYEFLNWTENEEIVSTDATYSFVVTGDRNLVANFGLGSYEITALADPGDAGAITGTGTYNFGETVTLVASPIDGYHFVNWTEDDVEVSTGATYSFMASANRSLVAHFGELVNHWEPEISDYEENMSITCILQFDGVEQHSSMYEVGAFCGTECRGSQCATYFSPTDRYIIQMAVFGEVNDVISFRLYDHLQNTESVLTPPASVTFTTDGYGSLFDPYVLNFISSVLVSAETNPADAGTITGIGNYMVGTEATLTANPNTGFQFLNWTLNGEVVSTSASYQFMVTDTAHYVANFNYANTQVLNNGWNWWSTYVELDNNDGLEQLENSIGSAGVIIKSRTDGYVETYEYDGETNWYGTLNAINNAQMYKICTNAACDATVAGALAVPANHPITIKNGWNWIGFPCNQNVSLDVAMSDFTPENNDVIKGRNGFTTYYSDGNYSMWYGTLTTLEVGKGYMYRSNSTTQKTLVYQAGRGETTVKKVTTENNVFQPVGNQFADNMTITAVLELDGEELRSDDYELAAFVGDECRGSVKLMYVEPVNRYVAFLTVFGEPSETLYFRLTNGTQTELSMDEVSFVADGMEGTLAEPKTLRFGTTQVNENEMSKVLVYPNPSNGVFHIQGQGIRKVEVFNAFGQAVVKEETSNDDLQIDLSRYANGYYMLRVVTENGVTNSQLIKK